MRFFPTLFASVLFAASTGVGMADTLSLASYGSASGTVAPAGVSNTAVTYMGGLAYGIFHVGPGNGATYNLNSNGVWAPAIANSSWVAQNAGDAPNGSNVEAQGMYIFSTSFTDYNPTNSYGSITVMADDTTGVFLNGVQITAPAGFATDGRCDSSTPNCTVPALYELPTLDFISGVNTLSFNVLQEHGAAEGLDFAGSVNISGNASVTPEPDSLLLLGTGLAAMAGLACYRRVQA